MFIRQRSHKHPNKREALELASERKDVRRGEEAGEKVRTRQAQRQRKRPGAKEGRQPVEAGKSKETDSL